MGKRKDYSVDEVLRSLSRKNDCRINPNNKHVFVLGRTSIRKSHDLGNGSWGKIDYLKNYCGYTVSFVDEF